MELRLLEKSEKSLRLLGEPSSSLTDYEKGLFASSETSEDIAGDYLQLEKDTFEDLKKRKKVDPQLKYEDVLNDPQLYDEVAVVYIEDLKKTFGHPDTETAALWSYRPGWYRRYKGDIEAIPDDKPGSFDKTGKEVMRIRKQLMEEYKRKNQPKPESSIFNPFSVPEASAEPTAQDFEQLREDEKQQKENVLQQQFFQEKIMQEQKQDPTNWTYQQSVDYFKQNPPQTLEAEATMEVFLEQKKQAKEQMKQGLLTPEIQQQAQEFKEHPFKTIGRDVLKEGLKVAKVIRWPFWRFIEHPISSIVTDVQQGKESLETLKKAGEAFLPGKIKEPKYYEDIWNNYWKAFVGTEAPGWYKAMSSISTAMGIEPTVIKGYGKAVEKAITRPATPQETDYIRKVFNPLKTRLEGQGVKTSQLHPEGNIIQLSDESELAMNKYVSAVLRGDEIRVPRWADIKIPKVPAQEALSTGREIISTQPTVAPQPQAGGLRAGPGLTTLMDKLQAKGVTIAGRGDIIRIDEATPVTDIYGNKVTLPKGEEYTEYKLSNNQILLHDGKNLVINKSQFQNVKGQNIVLGEKAVPPEEAQVEEVVKGELTEENIKKLSEMGLSEQEYKKRLKESQMTKFSQYQLPGGENYREVLFKVSNPEDIEGGGKFQQFADIMYKKYGRNVENKLNPQEKEKYLNLLNAIKTPKQDFKSLHWDEPNVLAHLRINDRTTPDGKKVLFIEEIQSDWARAGREKGFDKPIDESKITVKFVKDEHYGEPNYPGYWESFNQYGEMITRHPGSMNEKEALAEAIEFAKIPSGIPSHPLLKNWQEFTLKRILKEAVDKGYDYISWTTGEQQAERYDLSKQVDSIDLSYDKDSDQFYIEARKDYKKVIDRLVFKRDLPQAVGKDLAEKAIKSVEQGNTKYHAEGKDLSIGGEWAKNLYDRQVPNILKDLTRGQIESILLRTKGEFGIKAIETHEEYKKKPELSIQPALKITPEIRARLGYEQPKAGGLPAKRKVKTLIGWTIKSGGIKTSFLKEYFGKEWSQILPINIASNTGRDPVELYEEAATTGLMIPMPEDYTGGEGQYFLDQLRESRGQFLEGTKEFEKQLDEEYTDWLEREGLYEPEDISAEEIGRVERDIQKEIFDKEGKAVIESAEEIIEKAPKKARKEPPAKPPKKPPTAVSGEPAPEPQDYGLKKEEISSEVMKKLYIPEQEYITKAIIEGKSLEQTAKEIREDITDTQKGIKWAVEHYREIEQRLKQPPEPEKIILPEKLAKLEGKAKLPSFGRDWTPEQRKEVYQIALRKKLIWKDDKGKEHDRFHPFLKIYKGMTYDEIKNMLAQLPDNPTRPPKFPRLRDLLPARFFEKEIGKPGISQILFEPHYVFKRLGIEEEIGKPIYDAEDTYEKNVQEKSYIIKQWMDKVGRGKEISRRVWKYADKTISAEDLAKMTDAQKVVGDEWEAMAEEYADRLGIPVKERISGYVSHIIEDLFREYLKDTKYPFPQELIQSMENKYFLNKQLFDPFLQRRLGFPIVKEDFWLAIQSYIRAAEKKLAFDPMLKQVNAYISKGLLPAETTAYLKRVIKYQVLGRPTPTDVLLRTTLQKVSDIIGTKTVKLPPEIAEKLGIKAIEVPRYRPSLRPGTKAVGRVKELSYLSLIAGNIRTAIVNLTQTVGTLSRLKGWPHQTFSDMFIGHMKALRQLFSPQGWRLMRKAGIMDIDINTFLEGTTPAWRGIGIYIKDLLYWNMKATEFQNRVASAFAGARNKIRTGDTASLVKLVPKLGENALLLDKELSDLINFRYGPLYRPTATMDPVGQALYHLNSFNMKHLQLLHQMFTDMNLGKLGKNWREDFRKNPIGFLKELSTDDRGSFLRYILYAGLLAGMLGVAIGKSGILDIRPSETPVARLFAALIKLDMGELKKLLKQFIPFRSAVRRLENIERKGLPGLLGPLPKGRKGREKQLRLLQ